MILKCNNCHAKVACNEYLCNEYCFFNITDTDIKKEAERLELTVMKDMRDSMILYEEFSEGRQNT